MNKPRCAAQFILIIWFSITTLPLAFAANPDRTRIIALNMWDLQDPYQSAQTRAVMRELKSYAGVFTNLTDAQHNPRMQVAQAKRAIVSRASLLILTPGDPSLAPILKKGLSIGIPIICLNHDVPEDSCTTCIQPDNPALGRLAAQWIVQRLKKKNGSETGTLLRLTAPKDDAADQERQTAADEVFKKYPNIKVVTVTPADADPQTLQASLKKSLSQLPTLDGIFASNDAVTENLRPSSGYLTSTQYKKLFIITFAGLTGDTAALQKIKDKTLDAAVLYPSCVDKITDIVDKILDDKTFKPDRHYLVEPTLATPENITTLLPPPTTAP